MYVMNRTSSIGWSEVVRSWKVHCNFLILFPSDNDDWWQYQWWITGMKQISYVCPYVVSSTSPLALELPVQQRTTALNSEGIGERDTGFCLSMDNPVCNGDASAAYTRALREPVCSGQLVRVTTAMSRVDAANTRKPRASIAAASLVSTRELQGSFLPRDRLYLPSEMTVDFLSHSRQVTR
jgi:hypothetical protein